MATWLAVLLSAAMWFASTGVSHVWPLAWIAPLPLLAVLPDLRAGRAAIAALEASAVGALNLLLSYRDLSPVVLGVGVLFIAISFMPVALAWRAIARHEHPALAVIAYPALVVSMEYLVSLVSPHGTFGSPAYTQMDVPVVIQLASLTGLWGVSFIVSLVPAALAAAWRSRRKPKSAFLALLPAASSLTLVLVFGIARLAVPPPSQQVRVGLAVCDDSVRFFAAKDADEALPVIRAYAARVANLAALGARIIVLPERLAGVMPGYADRTRAVLEAVAHERRVTIVAGFNLVGGQEPRNVADVFGPSAYQPLEN